MGSAGVHERSSHDDHRALIVLPRLDVCRHRARRRGDHLIRRGIPYSLVLALSLYGSHHLGIDGPNGHGHRTYRNDPIDRNEVEVPEAFRRTTGSVNGWQGEPLFEAR